MKKRLLLKKKPNTLSLKGKMFLTISICFVFVVLFSLVNNIFAVEIIKRKTNDSVSYTAEQTDRYLSFLFEKARSIARVFSVNSELKELSSYSFDDNESYYTFYRAITDLYRAVIYQIGLNEEIHSMYIYMDGVKYLINSQYGIYSERFVKDWNWMTIANSINDSQKWVPGFYDSGFSEENLITYICRADILNRDIATPVFIGINFSEQAIMTIIEVMKITPKTVVYLISDDNTIMAAENKGELGQRLDGLVDFDIDRLKEKGYARIKANGNKYYQAMYNSNEIIDGGVLVLIPESELLWEQKMVWQIFIIVVSLIAAIFVTIGLKMIIEYVDRPVSQLVSFMKKAEQGDFRNKIEDKRKDEFGYLFSSYNQMIDKIDKLIQELYHEKLAKKEMEVKTLQQQINPHFLYNTLDTINWIAEANKIDSISKIVIALSQMYRITFNEGRDYIKISKMVRGIQSYLDIQKMRYGGSFQYELDISSEVEEYYILNLILQTVVENAIVHGIDNRSEDGLIQIKAFRDKDRVHFIVEDNGKGMEGDKLELIRAVINAENISSESGLRNIQKRLRLLYGEEYGLQIDSVEGKVTRVDIYVPIIEDIEEVDADTFDEEEIQLYD